MACADAMAWRCAVVHVVAMKLVACAGAMVWRCAVRNAGGGLESDAWAQGVHYKFADNVQLRVKSTTGRSAFYQR